MFVYKHAEMIEYVKKFPTFFLKKITLQVNNLRILRIIDAKFSGFYFYINMNITYKEILKSPLGYL